MTTQSPADHLSAYLTLVGAVFVVLVTAITTHVRHRQSLKHERHRLDQERARLERDLQAEHTRLELQLLHDRELRDLAELRSLVMQILAQVNESLASFLHLVELFRDGPASSGEQLWRRSIAKRRADLRNGNQARTDSRYQLIMLVASYKEYAATLASAIESKVWEGGERPRRSKHSGHAPLAAWYVAHNAAARRHSDGRRDAPSRAASQRVLILRLTHDASVIGAMRRTSSGGTSDRRRRGMFRGVRHSPANESPGAVSQLDKCTGLHGEPMLRFGRRS